MTYYQMLIMEKGQKEQNRNPVKYIYKAYSLTKLITWTVLPRPISSARIPFKWLLYSETNHLRPFIWYLKTKFEITRNVSQQTKQTKKNVSPNSKLMKLNYLWKLTNKCKMRRIESPCCDRDDPKLQQ